MNKFATAGLVLEAIRNPGLRIIAICHDERGIQEGLNHLRGHELLPEPTKFSAARGQEKIEYANGSSIRFFTHRSQGYRGRSADVVYLDSMIDIQPYLPLIQSSGGEIIRA